MKLLSAALLRITTAICVALAAIITTLTVPFVVLVATGKVQLAGRYSVVEVVEMWAVYTGLLIATSRLAYLVLGRLASNVPPSR